LDADTRQRLLVAAGRVSRPERNEQRVLARAIRKQRRRESRETLEAQLDQAPIRKLREQVVFVTPPALKSGEDLREPEAEAPTRLHKERVCYVCKEPYQLLHHFYDQLCPECGDFNFQKRSQRADLGGRTALITGARVKIGYQ